MSSKEMKIDAIIFDLDGVLVDSRELHYIALNNALKNINEQFIIREDEHLLKYDGLPTKKKLELLTKEKGLPSELHGEVWRKKQNETYTMIEKYIKPDENVINVIKNLKNDGYRIFCASNSTRKTLDQTLKCLDIFHLFEKTYCNEDVVRPKPHPEIYMKICVDFGIIPSECVVIEDSPIGRKSAHLAGVNVFAVPDKTYVIYSEIKNFINKMESSYIELKLDWLYEMQIVSEIDDIEFIKTLPIKYSNYYNTIDCIDTDKPVIIIKDKFDISKWDSNSFFYGSKNVDGSILIINGMQVLYYYNHGESIFKTDKNLRTFFINDSSN